MCILYVIPMNLSSKELIGVANKVENLVKVLESKNIEVVKLFFQGESLIMSDKKLEVAVSASKLLKSKLENRKVIYDEAYNILREKRNKCRVVMFRHIGFDPILVKNIKKIKKMGVKVIVEIPTYPYSREFLSGPLTSKFKLVIDVIWRLNIRKYVDFIVAPITEKEKLFGIPIIRTGNGIRTSIIPIKKCSLQNNILYLLGVANVSRWHGYDRVIKGLKNYTGNKKVVFHVVGEGKEKPKLIKLVKKLNLEDKVIFHGTKTGKELDKLFDMAHIAIGDIGSHRKGLKETMALKHREYAARGIPFVLSTYDPDFPPELDFVKYIPPNDEPVNIDSIVKWYQDLIEKNPNISMKMRKYAEENLTWEVKLKPVVEKIKELLKQKGVNT